MAPRDQSVLDAVAQDEMNSPLPQKKLEDRTIDLSRNDFGLQAKSLERPVITDFGLVAIQVIGYTQYSVSSKVVECHEKEPRVREGLFWTEKGSPCGAEQLCGGTQKGKFSTTTMHVQFTSTIVTGVACSSGDQ